MSDIDRTDLEALVAILQHEHFTYDGRGAAAARALKSLTDAIDRKADAIAIVDREAR